MKKVRILRDNLVRILSRVYHKQSLPPEFSHRTRGSRRAMDPDQDKTDFLNLIESSFYLLEKVREAALSATKSNLNQIAVVKVLMVLEMEEQSCLNEVG